MKSKNSKYLKEFSLYAHSKLMNIKRKYNSTVEHWNNSKLEQTRIVSLI